MTVHAAPKAVPKPSSPAHAPSLELRPARDRFESEAEHAAENALRPSQPAGPAPALSPLPRSTGSTGPAAPAAVSEVVGSTGSPLGAPTRETMERQFRSDFSHVRIHTDAQAAASARAIRATAYTAGAHIVFGDGAYNPQSPRGRHILAHELAHHVHHDLWSGLALETATMAAALFAAARVVERPGDLAALPLLALVFGAASVVLTPLANAWSRHNERRADRFALDLTGLATPFISAMRRLATQNLADERPSPLTYWFFHSHPTIEERIAQAKTGIASP